MPDRAAKAAEISIKVQALKGRLWDLQEEIEGLEYEEMMLRRRDDHHRQDDLSCTCPEGHFPPDRRDRLRKLPHNYEGVLHHHPQCVRAVAYRSFDV